MRPSPQQLAALRRGDTDAIQHVAREYSRRLYRAARGMGFTGNESEDLVQDVFVTFITTLGRFEGRASVHTWLFGILLRKAQERRRARAKEQRHDSLEEDWAGNFDHAGNWLRFPVDPAASLGDREAAAAIEECLNDLTAQQREVFALRIVEELPAAEVSNVLGLTITNIGVLLHRARLLMRKCLHSRGMGAAR